MYRKNWIATVLILSIGLAGLFSLAFLQQPAWAETLQTDIGLVDSICEDWSSISTITILYSDRPDPSGAGQSFKVSWYVLPKYLYVPLRPTGTVTVTGGGSSCQGINPGSCQLTISSPGSYVITAKYKGGYYGFCTFLASSDTESHTVTP